jgi:hypothetical protein
MEITSGFIRQFLFASMLMLLSPVLMNGQTWLPRPYVFGGGELMPDGYSDFAVFGGGGVSLNAKHLSLEGNAWFDRGHRVPYETIGTPKDHDHTFRASAYYRLSSGWMFGPGVSWSNQLSPTNSAFWRPSFGLAKDFIESRCSASSCEESYWMRLGADYFTKGNDRQIGLHGPACTMYLPSPSGKGHLFYREVFGADLLHDAVTDSNSAPTNAGLMRHYHTGFSEFTVIYRF